MTRLFDRRRIAAVTALAVVASLAGAGAASANHFRASGPDFSVTGNIATWQLTSAWASNSHDYFVAEEDDDTGELGGSTPVLAITAFTDVPGLGTPTGASLTLTSVVDSDEPLYAKVVETLEGDLSSLSDGLYELYVTQCCRVGDIVNVGPDASGDASQWVRFSKAGSTYTVAPRLTTPVIYVQLPVDGTTTMVSYAASSAVSWDLVTSEVDPYFGSPSMPCSTYVGGAFEVGAEHCVAPATWANTYLAGTFWSFKTTIADAAGRQSVAETLFRVEALPEPYIDRHVWTDNATSASFWAYAEDTIVNSWEIVCTNTTDPTDIATGASTSLPISASSFTAGETYDCVAKGTNGAGTGTSVEGEYEVTAPDVVLALALDFGPGSIYSGSKALIEGSGLDPLSEYTLTMFSDPILLDQGTTDPSGNFSNEITIPAEACIAGEHELRLVGTSNDVPVWSSQTIEIDSECAVLTVNGKGPQLAETGSAPVAFGAGALGLALALIGFMLMRANRTREEVRFTA